MRRRGFTLVEMMVTLAIMAVLVTVATPMAQVVVQRDREHELHSALTSIRDALDAYKRAADQGRIQLRPGDSGYPKTLNELVEGVPDIRTPSKQKIYFLRRLPRDPMSSDTSASASDTWGKRSYASPADDPKEGIDVFDVFSRSDKVALNGIPYRDW